MTYRKDILFVFNDIKQYVAVKLNFHRLWRKRCGFLRGSPCGSRAADAVPAGPSRLLAAALCPEGPAAGPWRHRCWGTALETQHCVRGPGSGTSAEKTPSNTSCLKVAWKASEILDQRQEQESCSSGGVTSRRSWVIPVALGEEALQLGRLYVRSSCRGQTSSRCISWEQIHLD